MTDDQYAILELFKQGGMILGLTGVLLAVWSSFNTECAQEYRERSCERKVCYSKESAIRAASHMQEKTGDEFDVYECDYCRGWHIGHSQAIRVTVESRRS